MTVWYWDKWQIENDTPSIKAGISPKQESLFRREGTKLINDVGQKMIQAGAYIAISTAVVYYHRFYMIQSFTEYDRRVTAIGCLFIAGKVEETPKKVRDLWKATQEFLTADQQKAFGKDPKEEIILMEKVLLTTLKFDLQVQLPYEFLMKYLGKLKGDDAQKKEVAQASWNLVNDCLQTSLCIQWEPEVVALGALFFTFKLRKHKNHKAGGAEPIDCPPNYNGKWWQILDPDIPQVVLEDVCHQLIDLYQMEKKHQESAPSSDLTDIKIEPLMTRKFNLLSKGISGSPTTQTTTTPPLKSPPVEPQVKVPELKKPEFKPRKDEKTGPPPSKRPRAEAKNPTLVLSNEEMPHKSHATEFDPSYKRKPPPVKAPPSHSLHYVLHQLADKEEGEFDDDDAVPPRKPDSFSSSSSSSIPALRPAHNKQDKSHLPSSLGLSSHSVNDRGNVLASHIQDEFPPPVTNHSSSYSYRGSSSMSNHAIPPRPSHPSSSSSSFRPNHLLDNSESHWKPIPSVVPRPPPHLTSNNNIGGRNSMLPSIPASSSDSTVGYPPPPSRTYPGANGNYPTPPPSTTSYQWKQHPSTWGDRPTFNYPHPSHHSSTPPPLPPSSGNGPHFNRSQSFHANNNNNSASVFSHPPPPY